MLTVGLVCFRLGPDTCPTWQTGQDDDTLPHSDTPIMRRIIHVVVIMRRRIHVVTGQDDDTLPHSDTRRRGHDDGGRHGQSTSTTNNKLTSNNTNTG